MKTSLLVVLLFTGLVFAESPQDKLRTQFSKIVDTAPALVEELDSAQLQKLFKHVHEHPVAAPSRVSHYDHQPTGIGNGEVGFCYGRAMAVQLAARRMGVKSEAMQKIYIAGDLRNSNVRWRFHMATMIRGSDRRWHIVDPIMPALGQPGVIDPATWMETVKNTYDLPDGTHDSKFYVSDPSGIMVDMSVIPASKDIEEQAPVIGERLINVLFDPTTKAGFDRVPTDEFGGIYDAYRITGDAKNKYLINFDEPLVSGKPLNNFDFFRFSTVILYRAVAGTEQISLLPRSYDYNGYFVDLLESFKLEKPLPDLDPTP